MDWAEVKRRIRAGEDAVTEFKRGAGDMRHAMRAFNDTEPELVSDQHDRYVRVTFHL